MVTWVPEWPSKWICSSNVYLILISNTHTHCHIGYVLTWFVKKVRIAFCIQIEPNVLMEDRNMLCNVFSRMEHGKKYLVSVWRFGSNSLCWSIRWLPYSTLSKGGDVAMNSIVLRCNSVCVSTFSGTSLSQGKLLASTWNYASSLSVYT